MTKLYISKDSDTMYELVKIENHKIFVLNDNVEGKFTVRPELDPLTVFEQEYDLVGEI